MKLNKSMVIGIIAIVIIGTSLLIKQGNNSARKNISSSNSMELKLVDAITHGHGLAVDVSDPNLLYIATHHGLLVLKNEKELYKVGTSGDDYMGFSPHPTDQKVFFSSGHPERGGNIGFQKSEDGGFTWQKVSNGINGPVDFHAMTVSPVNFDFIYGWYKGEIQRSINGGKNWEAYPTDFPIVNLAADSKDENILYAASPQGLFVSKNKGQSWERLLGGFVSVVAINPQDSQKLLSFSEKNKLARSNDGGRTWEKLNETFTGETPLFIAFSKQSPEIVYIITEKNSIYKSSNEGNSWTKIR